MTEQDLRAIVRESMRGISGRVSPRHAPTRRHRRHASFAMLPSRGGDVDGACLIEPAVRCTHCGYCQSYGH